MVFSSSVHSEGTPFFLGDFSDKDKAWDRLKSRALKVSELYLDAGLDRYGQRMGDCAMTLDYGVFIDPSTSDHKLKLRHAEFCRVRHCPICQERKAMRWFARFCEAFPILLNRYPKARFIFVTLTAKNCHVSELRQNIKAYNSAWQRYSQRKFFPAIGWMKSIEVTRRPDGMVHPHIHALLMVKTGYFSGNFYVKQEEWQRHWQECMRLDYPPIVHVQAIKETQDALLKAILETAKYQIKSQDIFFDTSQGGTDSMSDAEFLRILTEQLSGTKAVSLGGLFRDVMSEEEPEDLIGATDSGEKDSYDIRFGWREKFSAYALI